MPHLRIHDRSLAYDTYGTAGPWVVCLPGMGDVKEAYRHLAPRLAAAGHRVAVLDLRGHGASDVGFDDPTPGAVADDVIALLDHLGASEAFVVGNSAAASSAVAVAARHPERVCGLGLLGPVVRNPPSWGPVANACIRALVLPFWGRWAWPAFQATLYKAEVPPDHAEHLARIRANAASGARRRALLDNGMADKTPLAALLDDVRAPSVVVMGGADPDFPDPGVEAAEIGAQLGSTVHVLDGVGHYPHLEAIEATTDAVLACFREVTCRAA